MEDNSLKESADMDFAFAALEQLIECSHRDRRAIRKAAKDLTQAVARFRDEFPDYATVMALTEKAEEDQASITAVIKKLEMTISTLDATANSYVKTTSESVSAAVTKQIKDSLSGASSSLTEDFRSKLESVNSAVYGAKAALVFLMCFIAGFVVDRWLR